MTKSLFQEVVVNGERLPASVVAAETQNHAAPRGSPSTAWRKAADALAIRTLLLQEARRRGLKAEPTADGPGRAESDDESLIRQLLDDAIDVAPPNQAAVLQEWRKAPSRFRSAPLWEVSHILVACDFEGKPGYADAERRASAIRDALVRDPSSFNAIAERESDCPSSRMGGFLGQMRPGDAIPEFEAALSEMTEGEIGRPVLTRYSYHVIRLDAFAAGQVLPFEAVEKRSQSRWKRPHGHGPRGPM